MPEFPRHAGDVPEILPRVDETEIAEAVTLARAVHRRATRRSGRLNVGDDVYKFPKRAVIHVNRECTYLRLSTPRLVTVTSSNIDELQQNLCRRCLDKMRKGEI